MIDNNDHQSKIVIINENYKKEKAEAELPPPIVYHQQGRVKDFRNTSYSYT